MEWELTYRSVLAVDIEGSAGRGDPALLAIRKVLAEALRESFEQSRIDWRDCRVDDLGDGLRVAAPAGVRKAALLHPLFPELVARLRAHNRAAGPSTTVRVRMAVHAGDVLTGPSGELVGRPLEVLARLLDAPAARAALREAPPATVAVLVLSQHFHEETVPHGYPGIDPEDFHEVAVAHKEFTARAWLRLAAPAGFPPAPGIPAVPEVPGVPGVPDGGGPFRSRMVNNVSGRGTVYAVQHGVQHVTHRPAPN